MRTCPRPVRALVLAATVLLVAPTAPAAAGRPGPTVTSGVLERLVGESFATGQDATVTATVTTRDGVLAVPEALTGGHASGSSVDVTVDPARGGQVTAVTASGPDTPAGTTVFGTHRLVIVPVYWQTDGRPADEPGTTELAAAAADVDAYYDRATDGAIRVAVERVVPWSRIDVPAASCDTGAIESAARAVAGATTKDAYHHLVVYFPYTGACGFAGLATLGTGADGDALVWLNGDVDTLVVGHELGHNLGLRHSNGVTCYADATRTVRVPLSGDCVVVPYADAWDIMGNRAARQLSAAHLEELGLLDTSATRASSGEETVTLAPVTGHEGLRQVTIDGGGRTYHLEYRDAAGLDAGTDQVPGTGLAVRFATDQDGSGRQYQMINFHPDRWSPPLRPGEAWTEPSGAFGIDVGSPGVTGLPVTITRSVDRTPPDPFTITAPTAGTLFATRTLQVAWTPVTDVGRGVTSIAVDVNGRLQPAVRGSATTARVTGIGDGPYRIRVVATDGGGNTRATEPVTVDVDTVGPALTRAPAATLRPGTVAATALPVTVAWGLTDPHGVATQQLARRTGTATPAYTALHAAARSASGTARVGTDNVWLVRAADRLGNTAVVSGGWTRCTLDTQSRRGSGYRGAWTTATSSTTLGGSEQRSTARGASAEFTTTARSVGWVATRDTTGGLADVYIDGRKVTTVSLYSARPAGRQTVFTTSWGTRGRHTIRLVNQGTRGRPRMSVDAITTLS